MPRRIRLRNTAAIRGRSSAIAVSFSTIEARITASRGEDSGTAGSRAAHNSSTAVPIAEDIRRTISVRLSPQA